MTLAIIPGLGSVGATELIILLTIILLLFGAKRIPELARGLGTGVKEFKRGTSGEADKDAVKDRKEEQELPQSEAEQNDKVRAEYENTHAEQAGRKH
ncbi:MAG: twin-arginine translocase TatA/TatE family subunit [Actinobacteria bacterium]|nr:twin-arginine translocase TatA/TatE family subunit [Rubrobacter sp.]MCA1707969.1 twin-arginine translocase TatA/TatE family subunit [Actinomycetota bacterium]MDQ3638205.1 twin-arginine translocase TatA/TatE family subunit [Actinomycetota bacterium]